MTDYAIYIDADGRLAAMADTITGFWPMASAPKAPIFDGVGPYILGYDASCGTPVVVYWDPQAGCWRDPSVVSGEDGDEVDITGWAPLPRFPAGEWELYDEKKHQVIGLG